MPREILQKIFDNIPVLVHFIDVDGRIVLVNGHWERTLGWTLDEIQRNNLDIAGLCYPDPAIRAALLRFAAKATGEWADFRTTVRGGRVIDTRWVVIRLSDGNRIGIGQDVSESKQAQRVLESFSRRLFDVQEAERRRLAGELHDEIGQVLTGLTLILEAAARLPAGAARRKVVEAQELAGELLARVRNLSLDLRPGTLDELGLLPALLCHFERFTQASGVSVRFSHSGLEGRRFEPAVETAAYRIGQEALTNVARHAGVREVEMFIGARGDVLALEIMDRGVGFDPDAVLLGGRSSGVIGMRERARLMHGRFTVQSRPGAGTRLTVELPTRAIARSAGRLLPGGRIEATAP